jgi:hypothetical protein
VVHVRDDGDVAKTLAQNKCPSCWGKPRATRQTEGFGTDMISLQYVRASGFHHGVHGEHGDRLNHRGTEVVDAT